MAIGIGIEKERGKEEKKAEKRPLSFSVPPKDQDVDLSQYEALAKKVLDREQSPATKKEYERAEKRLEKAGVRDNRTLLKFCNKNKLSQAQYYVLRSSLEKKVAKEFFRHKENGDMTYAAYAWRRLESLRPCDPYDVKNTTRESADYHGDNSRSQSKKHSKLPKTWREKAVLAARNEQARERVSVLALTGCRPAELEKGVKIDIKKEEMVFHITGAKKHGTISGKDRDIVVKKERATCHAAWETLQKKGEGEHEIKKSRSTLAIDIKKIKEETKLDISAYNFRHDFATDQRKNGETREEIAEKMGHRSKVSQTAYGHKIPK